MQTERFKNEQPLHIPALRSLSKLEQSLSTLDFKEFPTIDEFKVIPVRGQPGGKRQLVGAYFFRGEQECLAGHPWWEQLFYINARLQDFTSAQVPLGTIEHPHFDWDVVWQILIFEHQNHVYVLEDDNDQSTDFKVWFRVKRERYVEAWLKAIREFNHSP